jgi:peptide chain release factor 3
VPLDDRHFSGFVFKVQTNMNPLHRDRMVFIRICSGKFVRDMEAYNTRLKKEIRLASSHNMFGRNRETASEAYPGDILGLVTKAEFRVGDTISTDPDRVFAEIPRFAPECFCFLYHVSSSTYKAFRKGMEHLLAEDIVQAFTIKGQQGSVQLLGAVGPLQFEVMQYRLKEEYGAESRLEQAPYKVLRWLDRPIDDPALESVLPHGAVLAADDLGRSVMLFPTDWAERYFASNNPAIGLFDSPQRL